MGNVLLRIAVLPFLYLGDNVTEDFLKSCFFYVDGGGGGLYLYTSNQQDDYI